MENEATEGTPATENTSQGQEAEGQQGEPKTPVEEEFEVVRSANREWKLPKDAATTFKHLEKAYRNATKELSAVKKKAIIEDDPDKIIEKALEKKGLKLSDYAEQVLLRQLQDMEKSPQEKELEKYRSELEHYKKKEQELATTKEKAQEAELSNYVKQEIDKEVVDAMKASDIPPSAFAAKQIAAYIYDSIQLVKSGKIGRVLTAQEAADIVKEEHSSSWKSSVQKLGPEKLFEILGESKFNELKKWELARLQENASKAGLIRSTFGSSSKEPSLSERLPKRPLTEKEYRKLMDEGSIA